MDMSMGDLRESARREVSSHRDQLKSKVETSAAEVDVLIDKIIAAMQDHLVHAEDVDDAKQQFLQAAKELEEITNNAHQTLEDIVTARDKTAMEIRSKLGFLSTRASFS
eukprot:Hpha_TRINITY_DN12440_c0_g2::TRINITY_DN12440_c0_g2_i1::g.43113::m.43113